MEKILFPLVALACWLAVPQIQASWAYVPLELGYTNKRNGGKILKGAVWAGELKSKAGFSVK